MRQHSPHHPITAATPPNPAPPVTRPPVKHPTGAKWKTPCRKKSMVVENFRGERFTYPLD